jgi:hypothetical protein
MEIGTIRKKSGQCSFNAQPQTTQQIKPSMVSGFVVELIIATGIVIL